MSYSSLNTSRSALSFILHGDLGNDPCIRRFCKGAAAMKPPKPRYSFTWDPDPVLQYLAKIIINKDTPLKTLTKKLVTLLALITGQRVQTLSLIRLENIQESKDDIKIMITDTIKTSGINRNQPLLNIPFYREKPNLCVASLLLKYRTRTSRLRKEGESKLLVTVVKPHKAAGTQTISRWIKEVLTESGIDTQMFSAHSTRHASTSAALRKGTSIDEIFKTAGWTQKSSTFARFYNRPLLKQSFASSILDN